jgi:hypothetical protein
MRGAATGFIGFGCGAFDAEQAGSETSVARQGIAQQCPERFFAGQSPLSADCFAIPCRAMDDMVLLAHIREQHRLSLQSYALHR